MRRNNLVRAAIGYDGGGYSLGDWDDEIVGGPFAAIGQNDDFDDVFSGDDEIVGAEALPQGMASQMRRIRAVDPRAVAVMQAEQARRRYLSIGMPTAAVAAGGIYEVEIKPQRRFRAEDLFFPDDVADACELISAQVGQNSMLAGGAPVPLAGFGKTCAHRSGILWDTANPGIIISLQIRNFSAASVTVRGELRGTSTVR